MDYSIKYLKEKYSNIKKNITKKEKKSSVDEITYLLMEEVVSDLEKLEIKSKKNIQGEIKFVCRLHSMRKNCKEFKKNDRACLTCIHFIEKTL